MNMPRLSSADWYSIAYQQVNRTTNQPYSMLDSSGKESDPNEFTKYLTRREADLYKFHPQWNFTNEEIKECKDLLKRDLTPICIPPSWDLVQKYSGALDENADGYDKEYCKKGKRNFAGDQGEAEFLDSMRNLEIGGILIGDVNSQHLLYRHQLGNQQKEYFMLPSQAVRSLKNKKEEVKNPIKTGNDFQFDFLYFDTLTGLIHIEIKRNRICTREKRAANCKQIIKQRENLRELFTIFCKNIGKEQFSQRWPEFFTAPSVLMHLNASTVEQLPDYSEHCTIMRDITEFKRFLSSLQISKRMSSTTIAKNLFKDDIFRQFVVFLAGYRPNFFISPVQCSLQVYNNIFTHYINTVSYYWKKEDKNEKGRTQNNAATTQDFLKGLKFVKDTNINFGQYENIYLTKEQMDAIGKFDENGNFSPKKQLILGPPGSGKSLILMIKMFICGQMADRKDRPIIYSARGPNDHSKNLDTFITSNPNAFCREIQNKDFLNSNISPEWRYADIFSDEELGQMPSLEELGSVNDGHIMYTVIHTGAFGLTYELQNVDFISELEPHMKNFDQITELRTIFRSSRQIQNYFSLLHTTPSFSTKCYTGHNFDGVKIEIFDFSDRTRHILRFVEERLTKLIHVEGCREIDLGVYHLHSQHYEGWKKIKELFKLVNFYHDYSSLKSLEFPVVLAIIEESDVPNRLFVLTSRAICHLIVCNVS